MFTCLCLHFRDFQLFFLWILVWCMCVVRRGLWVCMQSLVVNTGYLPWFSLPHFRDRTSHWTWSSSLAGLASQRAPEIYLSLHPNHGLWAYCVTIPGFYVVLGIQTQVLVFTWQGCYLLSLLPSPRFSTIDLSPLIVLSIGLNYIFLDCRFKFPRVTLLESMPPWFGQRWLIT